MAAYLGYTLRMRTLFHGWPIMVNGTHTRKRLSLVTIAAELGHVFSCVCCCSLFREVIECVYAVRSHGVLCVVLGCVPAVWGLIWGDTCSLRMPALRPASLADPMHKLCEVIGCIFFCCVRSPCMIMRSQDVSSRWGKWMNYLARQGSWSRQIREW